MKAMAVPKRKRRSILDYLGRTLVIAVALGLVWIAALTIAAGIQRADSVPFVLGLSFLFMAAGMAHFGLRDE